MIHARGLQTLFLVYPELLLVILGLLVAVGRYTGYRLSELIRFRDLADAPRLTPPALGAADSMRRFFARARALHDRGVLGINQRNGDLVLPLNPRWHCAARRRQAATPSAWRRRPTSRRRARSASSPITTNCATCRACSTAASSSCSSRRAARRATASSSSPAVENGHYRKSSGALLSAVAMRQHVSSTLSGVFSLRGDIDSCLIEERVVLHPAFADLARFGIPDVRVIVYRGMPIMAMCRLPTDRVGRPRQPAPGRHRRRHRHHQRARHARRLPQRDRSPITSTRGAPLRRLPDPRLGRGAVAGGARRRDQRPRLPRRRRGRSTSQHGPLLLELNARPGLAIQVANNEGLLSRLRRADRVPAAELSSWSERLRVARELF